MTKAIHILAVAMLLGLMVAPVHAQQPEDPAAATPQAEAEVPAVAVDPATGMPAVQPLTAEELNRPFSGSFFFSPLEMTAIQQAFSGRIMKDETLANESMAPPPRRLIRVAGVLYKSPKNWIVWMNNKKVTPNELLPEIVDISVKDSSKVSLKWYDVGLNQVISITLRPHQTYDIVTGILLPGTN